MERILDAEIFKPSELKCINRCRMFLRASRLSDICDSAGTSISPPAWQGYDRLPSTVKWPEQVSPGTKSWNLWRQALSRVFLLHPPPRTTRHVSDLLIQDPLGLWSHEHALEQCWKYYSSDEGAKLYRRIEDRGGFTELHRDDQFHSHSLVQFPNVPTCTVASLPPGCIPVDADERLHRIRIAQRDDWSLQPEPPTDHMPQNPTFEEYCRYGPKWSQPLLTHFQCKTDNIMELIKVTNTITTK